MATMIARVLSFTGTVAAASAAAARHPALDGPCHAVVVVRRRHGVGERLDLVARVAHRHAEARPLDHAHVVHGVADRHHLVAPDAHAPRHALQRNALALARIVGSKGYHAQTFSGLPYPVDAAG